MKKSSFVFLIMAIVYILLSVGCSLRMVTITNNIVLGLSLTALLISISDLISKIVVFRTIENEYQKMIEYTLSFIDEKIRLKQTNNPIIIIRNLRGNIEMGKKKKYSPVHPLEYANNSFNKALNRAAITLFVLGISVFIITPFINDYDFMAYITTPITVAAFASMCLSVFFDDQIQRKQDEQNNLISEKHALVQIAFPDFLVYYNNQMFHHNDIKAIQQEWETRKHEAETENNQSYNEKPV